MMCGGDPLLLVCWLLADSEPTVDGTILANEFSVRSTQLQMIIQTAKYVGIYIF